MQQNSFPINDFFGGFYRKQLHRMKIFIRCSPKQIKFLRELHRT